jgi:hypothetical protein
VQGHTAGRRRQGATSSDRGAGSRAGAEAALCGQGGRDSISDQLGAWGRDKGGSYPYMWDPAVITGKGDGERDEMVELSKTKHRARQTEEF